jgi:ribokinase
MAVDELARTLTDVTASVVVTDGPRGAYVGSAGTVRHVAGHPVEAVDTTGAGDEFAGRLVASLVNGETLEEAVHSANVAAARVVALPRTER